jgi:hypothetical protein
VHLPGNFDERPHLPEDQFHGHRLQ